MATASVSYTFVNGNANDGGPVTQNFTDVVSFLNNQVVHKDGSVAMTGQLVLPGSDPTTANQAARKAYVDWQLPIGAILLWPGINMPSNGTWLVCDGSAISRTTYSVLWNNVMGAYYGAGDGATTFNLPDLRGRVPVGNGTGTGLTARSVGQTGGAETHVLSLTEIPSHSHEVPRANPTGAADVLASNFRTVNTSSGTVPSNAAGGGGAHNNMQPFVVINYIVRAL